MIVTLKGAPVRVVMQKWAHPTMVVEVHRHDQHTVREMKADRGNRGITTTVNHRPVAVKDPAMATEVIALNAVSGVNVIAAALEIRSELVP